MKLIIVSVTVLICLSYVNAGEKGEKGGMLKAISGKCKKQENASDEDIEKMAKGESMDSKEGKCLAACLGEQFQMFKDNKLVADSKMMTKMVGNDEEKKKKMGEVLKICSEVTDPDRCEAANKVWVCLKTETKNRGLKFF